MYKIGNNLFSALYMSKKPSPLCHTFSCGSHSHGDRVCTRSGTTVQTASSQQQHTVLTSTPSQLSSVDSLDRLRVTVPLAFKVTPIVVSGTESDSGQNSAQTVGFPHFEIKISAVPKTTLKSVSKKWSGSR